MTTDTNETPVKKTPRKRTKAKQQLTFTVDWNKAVIAGLLVMVFVAGLWLGECRQPFGTAVPLNGDAIEHLANLLEDYRDKRSSGMEKSDAVEAFRINASPVLKLPEEPKCQNSCPTPDPKPEPRPRILRR
jgi:hypothetical protein